MHVELKLTFNTRNQFPLMLVSWTGQSPRLSSCALVTTVWSCFTKRRHSVSKHSTVSSSYYLWDTSKLPVEATRSNFINLRGHTVNHTQLPVGRNTSVLHTSLGGSLCVHQSTSSLVPRPSITANVVEGLVKFLRRMMSGGRWETWLITWKCHASQRLPDVILHTVIRFYFVQ